MDFVTDETEEVFRFVEKQHLKISYFHYVFGIKWNNSGNIENLENVTYFGKPLYWFTKLENVVSEVFHSA